MPSLVLGGVGLATQLFSAAQQGMLSYEQRKQAAALKLTDRTTPAEAEALATARQQQASLVAPGDGTQLARISQQTNNTLNGALRGGGSSAQVQAALAGADARGQSALADLGVRSQAYRQQATDRLGQALIRKGQQERADTESFSREKAALIEGATRNAFNASQSVNNGVAGASSIYMTGHPESFGGGPGVNGAIDSLNPNTPNLGPTRIGTYGGPPARVTNPYLAIGQPPRSPFEYGRY